MWTTSPEWGSTRTSDGGELTSAHYRPHSDRVSVDIATLGEVETPSRGIRRSSSARRRAATLNDVAERVGVSARTVSRVVNGQGGCSPETLERIQAAIRDLGYRPNLMARALLTNRSDTVGLVGVEMSDPFFTELADGVQRAAREAGHTMFFASTDDVPARQTEVLDALLGHGASGAIVFPAQGSLGDVIAAAEHGLPIVLVNHELTAPRIGCVLNDLWSGARTAVEHLIASGRRRIAMITDVNNLRLQAEPRRLSGYREALTRAGIPLDDALVVLEDNTVEGGRQATSRLLALDDRPDAIFAFNDLMAIGALQELGSRGVSVPDDVAVIGFDDIAMCEYVSPRLTTVRIDREELGRTAVELLWEIAAHPTEALAPVRVPVELVRRESA